MSGIVHESINAMPLPVHINNARLCYEYYQHFSLSTLFRFHTSEVIQSYLRFLFICNEIEREKWTALTAVC
jgi:hypothetical protein